MRGARFGGLRPYEQNRIIPADAGSTGRLRVGDQQLTDHPRGCGEHFAFDFEYEETEGSSPRMRGARPKGLIQENMIRIIPADAGSTDYAVVVH